jgi:hypothetical protein
MEQIARAPVKRNCRGPKERSKLSLLAGMLRSPGLESMIDADYVVRGEGISGMRRYLGEGERAAIRHPAIVSGLRIRIMGVRLPQRKGGTAATIIPAVACPMGATSAVLPPFWGGKGKFVNFYENGDELFDMMCQIESKLKVHSFFMVSVRCAYWSA